MRLFLLIALIVMSQLLYAEDDITCDYAYGYKYEQRGKILISRAFSEHREYFTLCVDEKESNYFVVLELRPQEIMSSKYIDPKLKSNSIEKIRDHTNRYLAWVLWLNHSTYMELKQDFSKLEETLISDDVNGLDGSTWCLEMNRGRECVWTPTHEPKKRGYSHFVSTGEKLWKMFKNELKSEELY
ncbi:hypothetical protein QFX18_05230 [Saccharophagus degradans]|uniref:hypothetical protein n=1 Tax=Saccharophagus degradans TaxID=86304 RepID=UPI002477E465|nr:hypothetical protein [Saccharophagus degradans]WGO99463.1 hypothetical protein QFX18_05230 [Saccharophagus degradans]